MSPLRTALVLSLLVPLVAHAAPTKVMLQLREAGAESAPIERALADAIKELPSLQLVKSGGARVLQADVARLGGGRVVYLQALEGTKPLASTTATLSTESGEVASADKKPLRGAILRVLDPARNVGHIALKIDVQGAVASLDGNPQASNLFDAQVGTHALRVTHPAYRDFLRFVEVGYDDTLTVEVALAAYPLTEGEMAEKSKKNLPKPRKLPWYRSWWALSVAGVALTGVAIGITFGVRPGIAADDTATYTVKPVP